MATIINISDQAAGVFDRLIDQSQFTISTSETKVGLVGVADKGPIGIPILLTGQPDFLNVYANPSLDGFGGLAAYNLLGVINQVYFTRIATPAAKAASGDLFSPATAATLLGSNFGNYSFGFGQSNNQLLIGIDGASVQAIEFPEETIITSDVITTLQAIFVGQIQVTNVSGFIRITSLSTGSTSAIAVKNTAAATTLGFPIGTVTGVDATSAFRTSPNGGTWLANTFNSADSLDVQFDNDVNKVVRLTGSFIDGIDNIVDLVTAFNNYAANNVDASLANSAVVDHELFRVTSPTAGIGSVVNFLNTTTLRVSNVLGISGFINNPVSGTAATSATILSTKKQGYNLTTANSLKFDTESSNKVISFNTSGNAAFSNLKYNSGTAITAGEQVLVDAWTFTFQSASGSLNSSNKTFNVAQGATSVDSYQNLAIAVNAFTAADGNVTATNTYNVSTRSGTLSINAVAPGSAGNSIAFNTTQIASEPSFVSKDPPDQTLGYGNGSSIADLTQVPITTVVYEINRQAGGIYAFVDGGKVRLTSNTTGASSSMTIAGGNASLGFVSGDVSNGKNTHDVMSVIGATTGIWANGLIVRTATPTLETATIRIEIVQNGIVVEAWEGDTINASLNFIQSIINANSAFITVNYLGSIGESIPAAISTTLANGDSGSFVTDQDVVNGINLYENKELININLFATPGYSSTAVLTALSNLGTLRQDVEIVVDPPVGFSAQQVVNWSNGVLGSGNTFKLDNPYLGLFWPWVRIQDQLNGLTRLVPPSVVMLELMANNDNQQAQWVAPAGTTNGRLVRAIDIERSATLAERNILQQKSPTVNVVNPIINILGRGIVNFGQRTTQRELTALIYLHVARLIIKVRRDIKDIALDLVFQPNDQITREGFVARARKVLSTIQSGRGIVDYQVTMDDSLNNTQTESEGQLFGSIIIKPRLVAEQIILNFTVVGQDFVFTT